MDSFAGFIAIIIAGLFALMVLFMVPVMAITYQVDKSRCATWGQTTNRETKFVALNKVVVPITWDCFTPDGDGRWIPINRVRDID